MTQALPASCPLCSGDLVVTRLHCRGCCTVLEGEFDIDRAGHGQDEPLHLLQGTRRARGDGRDAVGAAHWTRNPWRTT